MVCFTLNMGLLAKQNTDYELHILENSLFDTEKLTHPYTFEKISSLFDTQLKLPSLFRLLFGFPSENRNVSCKKTNLPRGPTTFLLPLSFSLVPPLLNRLLHRRAAPSLPSDAEAKRAAMNGRWS
jgi:hypothetical protein